jgi:polysaccharide biosynthesis transport protein
VPGISSRPLTSGRQRVASTRRMPESIPEYISLIRRRWRLVAGTVILITISAAAAVSLVTPLYRAEAVVMLQTPNVRIIDEKVVPPTDASEAAMVRDQMEVLKSRMMAAMVSAKLNLMQQPEFGASNKPSALRRYLGVILPALTHGQASQNAQQTIDNLLKRLDVENDSGSHIVRIDVTSENPQLAADIANAYANLYLEHQVEWENAQARYAKSGLSRQIAELRERIAEDERRIGTYKQDHSITDTNGTTVTTQQLAQINSQLVAARGDRLQKEAAIRQVKEMLGSQGGADAAAQVLDSPLIQRLREQETDVLQREAELATRYLPEHPAMVKVQAELDELRKKIADEVDRIVRGMANEAKSARAREMALKANLADLERSTANQEGAEIELHELERQDGADRALYDSLLTRFKEISARQDMPQPNAQIIVNAEPPVLPASPHKRRLIATSAGLSLIVGACLAFFVEQFDASFRRAEEVEEVAGVRVLGLLPSVEAGPVGAPPAASAAFAPLSEALRVIKSSLRQSQSGAPVGIVAVTSSVAAEGKTYFAASLGRSLAHARARCLLIDCHFRRPGVAKLLSLVASKGTLEPARATRHYPQIEIERYSGLHYIAAPEFDPQYAHYSQELFESVEMRDYLARMRTHYDLIILDAPPTPAVSDVVALSRLADTTIFLIRWGSTSRQVVLDALRLLTLRGVAIVGIVLSRTDMRRCAAYGYSGHLDNVATPTRARAASGFVRRMRIGRWRR